MNRKRKWITYGVLLAAAAVIMLIMAGLEQNAAETGAARILRYLSDGFFTVSVLYIGCGVLMLIQEAGNFYGLQYLFYTLTRLFSPTKERLDGKMTYFSYCQEKRERQAAEGKTPVKSAMLVIGFCSLALSLLSMALFYRLS